MSKIVLAYRRGLDAKVILHWLLEKGHAVITFQADIGQDEDLESMTGEAIKIGASKAVLLDLKTELVTDYAFQSIKAGAVMPNGYLLGGACPKPLIAQYQANIALEESALLAHGATPRQNDFHRFEAGYNFYRVRN